MSNRKLTILSIVAVLMVIWAVVQSRTSGRPKAEPDKPAYLIQGLDPDDIGSIVLGTTENVVTLKRRRGRFLVVEKDNYPTAASKINQLITSCLDIRTVELYTDNKANHKDLGVTEEDARSVVKFFRPDLSLITGVVIGKNREHGRGTYVRLASSDRVYVTSEAPWIRNSATDYIDQELIEISRDDIESVTVTSTDGDYTLRKKEQGIALENLPEGKKLKDSDYEQVFTALTNLRFNDVMEKAAENLNFQRRFVCRMKDSTVYTLAIAQKNDKTYITCKAEFTDKTPVTKEKGIESEEQLKKKEAKLLARDKAKDFSEKHQRWVYEIADYKAKNLTKQLSELVEDNEKPQLSEQPTDSG